MPSHGGKHVKQGEFAPVLGPYLVWRSGRSVRHEMGRRSVMINGIEVLCAECFLATREAGVESAVLTSLNASNAGVDWATQGAYNLERMMVHGTRRASDMREVAKTVDSLGLPNAMTQATAQWQDRVADICAKAGADDLFTRADRILDGL